jgi:hypothetical protein
MKNRHFLFTQGLLQAVAGCVTIEGRNPESEAVYLLQLLCYVERASTDLRYSQLIVLWPRIFNCILKSEPHMASPRCSRRHQKHPPVLLRPLPNAGRKKDFIVVRRRIDLSRFDIRTVSLAGQTRDDC